MRQTGFTLLEMLVALALSALLVAGLSQAIGVTAQGWRAVSGGRTDSLAVAAFLRRQIAAAAPLAPGRAAFAGMPGGMEFVAPDGEGTLLRLRLEASGGALWLAWAPVEGEGGGRRRLLAPLTAFELSYGAEDGWRPQWHEPDRLPRLVRLRVTAGGTPWPDLVVAPRVDWPMVEGEPALMPDRLP